MLHVYRLCRGPQLSLPRWKAHSLWGWCPRQWSTGWRTREEQCWVYCFSLFYCLENLILVTCTPLTSCPRFFKPLDSTLFGIPNLCDFICSNSTDDMTYIQLDDHTNMTLSLDGYPLWNDSVNEQVGVRDEVLFRFLCHHPSRSFSIWTTQAWKDPLQAFSTRTGNC